MVYKSSVLEQETTGEALPAGRFHKGPGASLAPVSSVRNAVSAVSCQYKNKSFTTSKNCTPGDAEDEYWQSRPKYGGKPVDNSPVSVRACYNRTWTMRLWKKGQPEKMIHAPFTCRTWRHEGPCRQWKGAQDFVRIKEGLEKRDGWVYMVLTYPHRHGNVSAVYQKIGRQFQHFRQWIKRNFAAPGEPVDYIVLAEQHRDGYPHVNVLVHCDEFVRQANDNWKRLRRRVKPHAMSTGFGEVFWLEPMRSKEAIAGYFVKLCGEVAKMSQAPMAAPKNFRRLRSSRGILPAAHKSDEYTGELVQKEIELAERADLPDRIIKKNAFEIQEEKDRIRRYEIWEQILDDKPEPSPAEISGRPRRPSLASAIYKFFATLRKSA